MKFLSYKRNGVASFGRVDGEFVIDLGGVAPDLKTAISEQNLAEARSVSGEKVPLSEVEHLPVIPNPGKILCIGLNYENHREETGRAKTDHPAVFLRFADSQLGHQQDIVRPKVSDDLDYEGELAVVIGKGGRYISKENALEHVAGYSCYNDATLRDWQRHTIQFTAGKNFPYTGGFGPWLVTPEDIPDPSELTLTTRLNGEIMQSAQTDQLIFDVPTLINYCSSFTPLSPGDVIATGTPGGVGFKRDPKVFMKPGDTVEVEISKIGVLSNKIASE